VTAIVANNSVNAGRQTVQGLDLLANYSFAIAGGNVGTSANVSYIESDQQIGPDDLVTPLAGSLFNPPHWRGRFDLHWSGKDLSVLAAVNYIGAVRDRRASPSRQVGGMAPVDLTIRYHPNAGSGLVSGLDVTASLQNLLNDKPSVIATSSYIDVPYDSTNYSAFGRVVSLMVTKTW
jgi:outer membrane receptor protein involved in Fe transport